MQCNLFSIEISIPFHAEITLSTNLLNTNKKIHLCASHTGEIEYLVCPMKSQNN